MHRTWILAGLRNLSCVHLLLTVFLCVHGIITGVSTAIYTPIACPPPIRRQNCRLLSLIFKEVKRCCYVQYTPEYSYVHCTELYILLLISCTAYFQEPYANNYTKLFHLYGLIWD